MPGSKRTAARATSERVPALYVDSSALLRVLTEAPDAPAIRLELTRSTRVASRLVVAEVRRTGFRRGRLEAADALLRRIALVPIDESILRKAETIEPKTVATLDAIHLATAVTLHEEGNLGAVMTYDKRLADGARHHGIEVVSPA